MRKVSQRRKRIYKDSAPVKKLVFSTNKRLQNLLFQLKD